MGTSVFNMFQLGAFFGAIFAFTLGDKIGRKKAIFVGLLCNTIGAVLQTVAWHFPQLIVGRIVNGFGMGITSSTCPVYQAECSKPRVRGKLVVLGSLSNTAAFCLANWINYGLYFQGEALQWRFPMGFQLIFPVVVASCLLFVPESPRWLLLQDRHSEALEVLSRLESPRSSTRDAEAEAQFLSIRSALEVERQNRVPTADVLMCRDKTQNLRRLLLSCGTQFMQQFSGVNALGYYLPTLLQKSVGLDEEESRLLTGINGLVYLSAAFCCLIIIDRFGRRRSVGIDRVEVHDTDICARLMLYGALTMGACYLVAAICLKVGEGDITRKKLVSSPSVGFSGRNLFDANRVQMGRVTTSMFFLYYFFYGTSFAKVPWVYNSEINSLG